MGCLAHSKQHWTPACPTRGKLLVEAHHGVKHSLQLRVGQLLCLDLRAQVVHVAHIGGCHARQTLCQQCSVRLPGMSRAFTHAHTHLCNSAMPVLPVDMNKGTLAKIVDTNDYLMQMSALAT